MEIVDSNIYPHLAAFQMREAVRSQQKRQDRELIEQFGKIEEEENEQIWNLERLNKGK